MGRLVIFDGKHWIGRKSAPGPLEIPSYEHVADIVSARLGEGGIVAIPNARGPDHKIGPEYRYEEFVERAEKEVGDDVIRIGNGEGLHDEIRDIYFIKAQEVNASFPDSPKKRKLVYLAYNLPFGKNLPEANAKESLEQAVEWGAIMGINAVSDPDVFYHMLIYNSLKDDWLGWFDFVVTHQSTGEEERNKYAAHIYNGWEIGKKEFKNPTTEEEHEIGQIAVSGGYRTPSIGSSYIEIAAPRSSNVDVFFADLRDPLRSCRDDGDVNRFQKGIVDPREKIDHDLAMIEDERKGHR